MLPKDFRLPLVHVPRALTLLKDGGKLLSIRYGKGREPLVLQTPPMYIVSLDDFYVHAEFETASGRGAAFFEMLLALDNFALQTASDRSADWMNVSMARCDVAPLMRRSIVCLDPPTVRLKRGADPVEVDTVVRCLVEVPCIWLRSESFGVSLRILKSETYLETSCASDLC